MKKQGSLLEKQVQKKVKMGGMDIPSAGFMGAWSTPKTQQSNQKNSTQSKQELIKKLQSPSSLLYKVQNKLPENLKSAVGPNIMELKKFQSEQEKKKKIEEQKIQMGLIAPKISKPTNDTQKSENFSIDTKGYLRDEKGNIVVTDKTQSVTLKVNKNRIKDQNQKKLVRFAKIQQREFTKESQYYDKNLHNTSIKRRERKIQSAFHFIEKGSIVKRADHIRDAEQINQHMPKEQQQTIIQQNLMNMSVKKVASKLLQFDPIPEIEWWDLEILNQDNKFYLNPSDNDKYQINIRQVTNMIEHPLPFDNPNLVTQNVVIPMYLTVEEQKKLRRRKRKEKEQQQQDKIRLGLIAPPPPKVKLANMMRVLGQDAIMNPSQIEADVRNQIEDRKKQHQIRNLSKKLTKEEKKTKMLKKLKKDSSNECRAALYRVEDLSFGGHKFKIEKTAKKLALQGCVLIVDKKMNPGLNSIVSVEGGPKAIKQFKNLMDRRIHWEVFQKKIMVEQADGSKQEETITKNVQNKCHLVWEGLLKQNNFKKWYRQEIESDHEALKFLKDNNVEQYWDLAQTFIPTQQNY